MMPARPILSLAVLLALLTLYRIWVILRLGLDPYVDEAYYWGWAQQPDFGYFSKPPLVAWLIALSTGLFGKSLLALKLPSLLLYPAAALVLQHLGTRMFDARVGWWTGLAFATLPLVSALGLFVSTDALLLFFWAAGLLALWSALEHGDWRSWLLVGLWSGLGLMSKYTMAAFIGSAFLAVLADRRGRRQLLTPKPWVALALAALILAPNLWWNWQHDFPTFRHTAHITRVASARHWSPADLGEFLGAQALSLGPLLSLGFLAALWGLRRTATDPRYRSLALVTVPLLVLVCYQAATGRANSNWAAPIFVGGVLLTVAYFAEKQRWRFLVAAVTINALVMLGAYHWPDILRLSGKELTGRNDPYKRARGWHDFALAIAPYVAANPDAVLIADDRDLLAQLAWALGTREQASWNPGGHVMDHYQLTTHLEDYPGRPFLYVSRDALGEEVLGRFATATLLGQIDVVVHRDFDRRAFVYRLEGFKGYR
jgi:4-amino-4-deoxy-L-arabinose transferase-like glycosyltransferase